MRSFALRVCVCARVCERGRHGHTTVACVRETERETETERDTHTHTHTHTQSHHSEVYSPSEIVLIVACLQTHTSFITVSVTRLCSPLRLELMVKLRTLLTVFTFILKAKTRDYGKGRYISESCLWCSANHNALGQLANQSRLCLSEGGTL